MNTLNTYATNEYEKFALDPSYICLNQQLTGNANPKTLIAPIIAPRLTDLEHWHSNTLVTHSHINSHSRYDLDLLGYNEPDFIEKPRHYESRDYESRDYDNTIDLYVQQYNELETGHVLLPKTRFTITDPRDTGSGLLDRGYIDTLTDQPRFSYEDIDSITMPKYLIRSNIDFVVNAHNSGPLKDCNIFGESSVNVRSLINNEFIENSSNQREDLMETLLRKRNKELEILKKYPRRTF